MKILNVKPLEDGIERHTAESIWNKTEANASYQFNKSHATEYSIISVWTMWVRCRYPAEYFAACMSIVKDDKLPGLVNDARECGIEVLPPNVNLSRDKYTIPDDKHILAPFSCVSGSSENTALRIMEMRDRNGGRFESKEEFAKAALKKGSKVNARVVDNLDKVGAFAEIEPGSLPARHLDRRKDQTELMPGLIIDAIKADRVSDVGEKFLRAKIITLVQEYKKCTDCSLAGTPHPSPRCKATVKYMVVSDCPTWQEEKKDQLLEGDAADYIKAAIKDAGLRVGDGYFTTLVKAKKSDKFLTNAQLNGCRRFIDEEVRLVKPAIIIALGSATIKHFLPGIKGSTAELAGKVIYDPKLDASIVCGINAQQIGFDPTKADILSAVFSQVADMLN